MATAVHNEHLAQMTDLMLEASTSSSFATAGSELDYHPGAKRGYPGTNGTYITPPLQRKGGAVPAAVAVQVTATQRTTVMAVRVVEPPPLFIEPKIALPPAKPATTAAIIEPTPCTWALGAPAPRRLRAGFARKLRKVRTARRTRHQPHGPPCRRGCHRSRLLALSVCHHLCRSHHHPAQAKTTGTPRPRIASA
jgi:hypothetical protein